MKATKIKTVTLNPATWLRGDKCEESALLLVQDDGKRMQCCIGFACSALGVSDRRLNKIGTIADMRSTRGIGPLSVLAEKADFYGHTDTLLGETLYKANDTGKLSDSRRVEKLNTILQGASMPLRFRLKKERAK